MKIKKKTKKEFVWTVWAWEYQEGMRTKKLVAIFEKEFDATLYAMKKDVYEETNYVIRQWEVR